MKPIFNTKFLFAALFSMIIFSVGGLTPVLAMGGLSLIAQKFVQKTSLHGALFTSVDTSALAAYAGDYEKQLFHTMINGLDIAQDIRVLPNVKNKRNLTKLTATANAKPFVTTEEYQGGLTYTPRVIEVKQGKVELLIDLNDYQQEWMAEMMGPGSHANKGAEAIPFAQYTWQRVIESLQAEINNRTAYFGFDSSSIDAYDNADHPYSIGDRVTEVTSGVINYYEATAATSSGENPAGTPAKWKKVNAEAIAEGFKDIITAEIADGKAAINTGAVTTGAEALAAQRKLFRALPDKYKSMGVTLYQSYTDYELLMDGIEDKISKYTKDDNTPVYLPGTDKKCMVKPVTWMSGSRRLIATPKNNLILATDLLSDINEIKVLENSNLWTMPVGIKFGLGFQIQDMDAIEYGDQT